MLSSFDSNVSGPFRGLLSFGPFDILGVIRRADQDAARIEAFIRAGFEGVSRRIVYAQSVAETDPIGAREVLSEARALSLATGDLAATMAEIGLRTVKKLSVKSVLTMLFNKDAGDPFKAVREQARSLAAKYAFPPDVLKLLGVNMPPDPPGAKP